MSALSPLPQRLAVGLEWQQKPAHHLQTTLPQKLAETASRAAHVLATHVTLFKSVSNTM